jgi:mannose-6-phosphate isomerase-like protein (cupin superfamily)
LSIWKTKTITNEKPWGSISSIDSLGGAKGKIIRINADQRTSLKYYPNLAQVLYCLSGKVIVYAPMEKEFGDYSTVDGNYFELEPGDLINIQAGNKYRLKAYDTSVLVEIRTGRQNTSTKIMVADDYGRLQKESTGDKND